MQNLSSPYTTLPSIAGLSFAPYPTVGSISYLPFSAFIFALTYRFYLLLGAPSRFLYYFLLKQPMVLADVGVALVLAKILLLSGNERSARTASMIWLYFPLGIIISSVWGQLDPLALFLSLLSIYFLLTSKWLTSAVMLGLAIYLKTLPFVFLPVLLLQSSLSAKSRLVYSGTSLAIPVLGTVIPLLAFNWGIQGLYNNVSFQVVIPSTGAMSLLGQASLVPSLLAAVNGFTSWIWIPVMFVVYAFVWKRNLPLFQGLVIAVLAFSISRPFLPEQWSLYPLAFLLLTITARRLEHFLGLSVAAMGFLLTNNTFLVRFFSPISIAAFNWDIYVTYQSSFAALRVVLMFMFALVYFAEAMLVVTGRESFVYRAIVSVKPVRFLLKRQVSPMEVTT